MFSFSFICRFKDNMLILHSGTPRSAAEPHINIHLTTTVKSSQQGEPTVIILSDSRSSTDRKQEVDSDWSVISITTVSSTSQKIHSKLKETG